MGLSVIATASSNVINLKDWVKVEIIKPIEANGAVSVNVQDQTTEIVDYYLTKLDNVSSLTVNVSVDDKLLQLNSTVGAVAYNAINIYEEGHYFQALILSISGNNITINAPLDYNFTSNAIVEYASWNMNVDGSTTPIEFKLCVPSESEWDITRMMFSISDNTDMDDGKFGGIPSLTNGFVLRVEDGYYKNIFVVNDNGGFAERCYDTGYSDKAPAGLYGFKARRTFGGQDKNGVVVRLNGTDRDCITTVIQDDLTDLTKLAVVAQGHNTLY